MNKTVDTLYQRLTHQVVFHNTTLGRSKEGSDINPLAYYFEELDSDHLPLPVAMDGDTCLGWTPPCSSVFELLPGADPRTFPAIVRPPPHTFDALDLVVSIAGAPHTLDHEAALSLYRQSGWLQDEQLTIDPEREDLANVLLLYRPTLVVHDRKTPSIPFGVATAELRIELAGQKGLITSARVLGLVALHQMGYDATQVLARIVAQELGNTSCYWPYARNDGQFFLNVSTPQSNTAIKCAPRALVNVFFASFEREFSGRVLNEDNVGIAPFSRQDFDGNGPTLEELEGDCDFMNSRERVLSTMSAKSVHDIPDCARLFAKLEPETLAAIEQFAAAEKRPGFSSFLREGRNEAVRVDAMDIHQRIQQASASITVEVEGEEPDLGAESMATESMLIEGIAHEAIHAEVLLYYSWRDAHPFETWDNAFLGIFDTLELLFPGAADEAEQGDEAICFLTLEKLGYSQTPLFCLILQPPETLVSEDSASRIAAGMLIGAARITNRSSYLIEDTFVCIELPIYNHDLDREGGEFAEADSMRLLAAALIGFGFVASSERVYACQVTCWERICSWDEEAVCAA